MEKYQEMKAICNNNLCWRLHHIYRMKQVSHDHTTFSKSSNHLRVCTSPLSTLQSTKMDQDNLSVADAEQQRPNSSSLPVQPSGVCLARRQADGSLGMDIGCADNNSDRRHLNTTFAQLDLETLRYLFPNSSYAVTCRESGCGSRCKTPSLERLWQYIPL
jgi:hypothetical protein